MAKIKLKFESTLKKLKFDEAKLSKQIKSNIEEIRKATDGIDDADVDMDMVNKDDEELVDAIEKYVNIDYPKVQKMVEGRANKKAASQTPPAVAPIVEPTPNPIAVVEPPIVIAPVVEPTPAAIELTEVKADGGEVPAVVEGEKKGGWGWVIGGIVVAAAAAIGINIARNKK